jgi:hypothetical protein
MAKRIWQVQMMKYCEHAGREIAFEKEVAYPADHLPDQPPRILASRCSNAIECNTAYDNPVCSWCGTNPTHEPS